MPPAPTQTDQSPLTFDPAKVKRVLIYRLGSLGDTTIALPSLHLIARAFPSATRHMLTNIPVHAKAPAAAAILGGSSLVHGYIDYPVGTRSVVELAKICFRIRRFNPDVLVYLSPLRPPEAVQRDAKFFRVCGVRHIVGLPTGDMGENRFDPATGLWEREAARLLRCIRALGEADINDLRNWDLQLTAAETAKAAQALAPLGGQPIIACGPGTKMQSKDWGQEKWRALLTRLSAQFPHHALALIGAKDDKDVADYAAAGWKAPVVNLCGQISPRESAAVIRHAQLFLGPDSGPMHLAAAYGVPCAICFASVDKRGRWFPIGTGHRPIYHDVPCSACRLTECYEKQKICINSITVDEMFQAALEAISYGKVAQ